MKRETSEEPCGRCRLYACSPRHLWGVNCVCGWNDSSRCLFSTSSSSPWYWWKARHFLPGAIVI